MPSKNKRKLKHDWIRCRFDVYHKNKLTQTTEYARDLSAAWVQLAGRLNSEFAGAKRVELVEVLKCKVKLTLE